MPGVVTVACKLPNGVRIQLQKSHPVKEFTIYGPIESQRWERVGKPIVVAGYRTKNAIVQNGFAFTSGIDADLFDEWMKQNAESDVVQNKLIFAAAKPSDVEARVREHRGQLCGFEALEPRNPPDEFKPHNVKEPGVTPAV